jgi:hypothetical protein
MGFHFIAREVVKRFAIACSFSVRNRISVTSVNFLFGSSRSALPLRYDDK